MKITLQSDSEMKHFFCGSQSRDLAESESIYFNVYPVRLCVNREKIKKYVKCYEKVRNLLLNGMWR